ncbi:MAG: holo-ACP synthase [Candidatus Sungbacteria bacterium]|nr:holo-ACP synthase [Candidatus Sungbacteria bacterium]
MSIGIDLVYIPEFQRRLERSGGVEKVFTEAELAQNPKLESLAGIFAAKEAFMKAIGRKIDWHDAWMEKKESGQPILQSRVIAFGKRVQVSISHDGDYAVAFALLEEG